jgi:polyisoprenoid-binding protein YceI
LNNPAFAALRAAGRIAFVLKLKPRAWRKNHVLDTKTILREMSNRQFATNTAEKPSGHRAIHGAAIKTQAPNRRLVEVMINKTRICTGTHAVHANLHSSDLNTRGDFRRVRSFA